MRWRRLTRECAISLLLGAVLTVAAAWGLAAAMHFEWIGSRVLFGSSLEHGPPVQIWSNLHRHGFGHSEWTSTTFAPNRHHGRRYHEQAHDSSRDLETPRWFHRPEEPEHGAWTSLAAAHGWPRPAMRVTAEGPRAIDVMSWRREFQSSAYRHAWIVDLGAPPQLVLPLAPVWPGVALDTVVFAAAAWLLVFGPFALRRRVRRRRRRCVNCGYDAGALEQCPECGAAQ